MHTVALESDKILVITENAEGVFNCDVFFYVEIVDESAEKNGKTEKFRENSSAKRRRNRIEWRTGRKISRNSLTNRRKFARVRRRNVAGIDFVNENFFYFSDIFGIF